MFEAPAVAWEISAPPTTPRGTSRSPWGLTTRMEPSLLLEPERLPGRLAARDVVAERVGIGAERLGQLEGDPLHERGEREARQQLAELGRSAEPVDGDADLLGGVGDLGQPRGAGAAAVEGHERVALVERHRRAVEELLDAQ